MRLWLPNSILKAPYGRILSQDRLIYANLERGTRVIIANLFFNPFGPESSTEPLHGASGKAVTQWTTARGGETGATFDWTRLSTSLQKSGVHQSGRSRISSPLLLTCPASRFDWICESCDSTDHLRTRGRVLRPGDTRIPGQSEAPGAKAPLRPK
jgi:hypothetical protein